MAAKPTKAEKAELIKIKVLSPIFDGEQHEIGDELELPAKQAQPLIECGAAELIPASPAPAQ